MSSPAAAGVDEHGRPRANVEGFPELSAERVAEIEQKRQAILSRKTGGAMPASHASAPSASQKSASWKSHMTQEEFDALGYPKVPEEWTEEWMREQIQKESVDPRENPNLLLDETHQEFWNNASRKPYAKAILRSEQHWVDRKNVWLRQYERVEIMNQLREEVAEELEECSMEVRRLVAPMMKHKICETALWNCLREARERDVPFRTVIEDPEKLQQLRGMRHTIDLGGEAAAAALMAEFSARASQVMDDRQKEREKADRGHRVICDTDTVTKRLNQSQKLRKDGHIEWHKGNVKEALASWREANEYLKRLRLPETNKEGNAMIAEMHTAILKNIAQAAIRSGYWTEALDAADDALRIDDQDHKAWFRRACALEGLGRFTEEEEALQRIEDLAVGRPDRGRIQKDISAKRDRLRVLADHGTELQKRGIERALAKGLFQNDRELEQQPAIEGQSATVPALLADMSDQAPWADKVRETFAPANSVEVRGQLPQPRDQVFKDRSDVFDDLGDFKDSGMCFLFAAAVDMDTPCSEVMWTCEVDFPMTVYLDFARFESSDGDLPPWLVAEHSEWALSDFVGTTRAQGSTPGKVYKRTFPPGKVEFMGVAANGQGCPCYFLECALPPFREGDVVFIRKDFADLKQGQRGAVVELDTDGDARVRFEGQDEDELIFKMDFNCVARDPLAAPQRSAKAVEFEQRSQQRARQRLTKEGTRELLEDLCRAYGDTSLQKRVAKLARDMRWEKQAFLLGLRRIALEIQAPILTHWGFEVSGHGVAEMQLAVQDHTLGPDPNPGLTAKVDEAGKLLYGEMWSTVFAQMPCTEPLGFGPDRMIYGVG